MVWGTVRERVEGRDGGPNGERDRERGKCALAVFNICSREGERGSERNRERERAGYCCQCTALLLVEYTSE